MTEELATRAQDTGGSGMEWLRQVKSFGVNLREFLICLLSVSPLAKLATHSRFFLTLRSQEGIYHPLILFRLTSDQLPENGADLQDQIYVMEANCPHLGADMSHAEIEECDTGVVAVCPWHRYVLRLVERCIRTFKGSRYDFDLKTGHSETGLKACTYATDIRKSEEGEEYIWIETPEEGTGWRLVEFRPVSEGAWSSWDV